MQSEEENINVRAAIVHMVGDMIQSLGVIAAALIIYFKPDWTIADPICTFLFSILVMFTTVPIFKDCMRILMENAPKDIDTVELFNALLQVSSPDLFRSKQGSHALYFLILARLRQRGARFPPLGDF